MMLATVNIAFSSSRNAALNERKILHYETLPMKIYHCTLSELKTQVFTLSLVLACLQYSARLGNSTQTRTF